MSTKFPSPLLGYNNNVRHKGKVFHIQTEDSGVRYGHIITHLFADGGRILKSVKTSYAEHVGDERMGEIVREMMKQQHKAMFVALRDGKFDPGEPQGSAGPASSQDRTGTSSAVSTVATSALDAASAEGTDAAGPPEEPVTEAPGPGRAGTATVGSPTLPHPVPEAKTPTKRRYAPTRPASIFGQARPQQGKSLFGEDLVKSESLDEVILSYLSADVGEKK